MRILVIGSGGREHALVWKLAQSPRADEIWCAPGNAGIAGEVVRKTGRPIQCRPIAADDIHGLLALAKELKPDLTVVGPDNPLALGVVDLFQKAGLKIWGPNRRAAHFEASKAFAQDFMERHGIPTAKAGTFMEIAAAKKFASELGGRCAVKADGLALGKGVIVTDNLPSAENAIDEILLKKSFGEAGNRVVIQEFLEGMEISLHALCDGKSAKLFPTSQDHKAIFENDQGPNTGGMGTYSPTPFLTGAELGLVETRILEPWLEGCQEEGIDYRGILYPGVMLTKDGPKVLEFNARFGDPEAQVYLTRLENDLVDLLEACVHGTLDHLELVWKKGAAVCVIMAAEGYPANYRKSDPILGIDDAERLGCVKVFHAGTRQTENCILTNGGRVLGVTAWASTLEQARRQAYLGVEKISFKGAQFRRDIGAKALAVYDN